MAKKLVTDQLVLTIGYDIESLKDPQIRASYHGPVSVDFYGRSLPGHAHGTIHLDGFTSSTLEITRAMMELFDRIIHPALLVRRVNLVAAHIVDESAVPSAPAFEQLDLFTDYAAKDALEQEAEAASRRERSCQRAVLEIRRRFGKNAILMGMNFQEGGTTIDRNQQIGGHKA